MRNAPGPAANADRVTEWLQLLAAVRAAYEVLDAAVTPLGLMLRDYELLRCLSGRAMSQTTIVEQLKTSKVSVSRRVRRLGAQGWLKVTDCQHDRRASTVMLTDSGSDRLDEVADHVDRLLVALSAGLDEEEHRMLGQFNEALSRLLQRHEEECTRE